MGSTPEGLVKAKVRKVLGSYDGMYVYWPVPGGYGQTTLDLIGCYRGRFFAIETKADGQKPTLRQHSVCVEMERAMGKVFVIAGVQSDAFRSLIQWLEEIKATVANDPHISPDPVRRTAIPD